MTRGGSTAAIAADRPVTRSVGMLSRREAAALARVSVSLVDKAIEQGVIDVVRRQREAAIPAEEIALLVVMREIGIPLPVKTKRQIRDWLVGLSGSRRKRPAELKLTDALVVRQNEEVPSLVKRAKDYTRLRERYIESDPEVKGGAPVIKGTRLTASAVGARLEGGDSLNDVAADYPYVDRAALEAAAIYGRSHPRRGRPPRPNATRR